MQIIITFSVIYDIAVIAKTIWEITCLVIHHPPAPLKVLICLFAFYLTKHRSLFYVDKHLCYYIGSIIIFDIV